MTGFWGKGRIHKLRYSNQVEELSDEIYYLKKNM